MFYHNIISLSLTQVTDDLSDSEAEQYIESLFGEDEDSEHYKRQRIDHDDAAGSSPIFQVLFIWQKNRLVLMTDFIVSYLVQSVISFTIKMK